MRSQAVIVLLPQHCDILHHRNAAHIPNCGTYAPPPMTPSDEQCFDYLAAAGVSGLPVYLAKGTYIGDDKELGVYPK